MNKTKNILIVCVGGQGSLLASRLCGNLLMNEGYDVKVSEVHGMSQRGGNVMTYVRYGDKVHSPIIDVGQAEIIIGFELLESARWLKYLTPGGKMVTNIQRINPLPVITGAMEYPEDIAAKMRAAGADVDEFDALAAAITAGSGKAVNVAVMGRASRHMDFPEAAWLKALAEVVPAKMLDVNIKAFDLGRADKSAF